MRRVTFLLGIVVTIGVTAVGAQDRPDFSGVWDRSSSPQGRQGASDGSLGSGWGPHFTIWQVGDTLTLERPFFRRSDIQPPLKYRYSLDGSETTNRVLMGHGIQEQTSTATWRGDTLIITTLHVLRHPETHESMAYEVTRHLSLDPPRLPAWPPQLVVETTRAGALGGPPSTTRTVYNRN